MDLRPVLAINSLKNEKDRRLMLALAGSTESYTVRRQSDGTWAVVISLLVLGFMVFG